MNYLIKPSEIIKINETSGTIQNTDQINRVEISDSENFTDNIILLPLNFYTFQSQIFVRLFDNNDLPVEVRVIGFQVNSGGGGNSTISTVDGEVATDDEFNEMLDDIGLGENPSIPTVDGEVATDDEFNEMLDDIGI